MEKAVSICWVYLILPKLVPINTKELLSAGKKRKKKKSDFELNRDLFWRVRGRS